MLSTTLPRVDTKVFAGPTCSPGFKDLERRGLAPSSIRRKLAAVASLFDHLCEVNAVSHNPVRGVKRPKADNNEGKMPALSRRPGPGAARGAAGEHPQGQ